MNNIKQLLNKLINPRTYSSEAYVNYLKKCGAIIGNGTWFVRPSRTVVDEQKAEFIEIGENCCITSGVTILAHDWSYSVVARVYNDAPGKQEITHIGNNVFIGMNAIILMGANIGNNVIIGAGSVVSGKVESNSVYAGNPARKICTLEEHYRRLQNSFDESALITINRLEEIYGQVPSLDKLGLYASLFVEKTPENMKKYFANSKIPFAICKMKKKYNSYEQLNLAMEKRKGKNV